MARLHKMRCSSSSADGDGSFRSRSLSFCRLCAFASACYYAPISRSLSPDPTTLARAGLTSYDPPQKKKKRKRKGYGFDYRGNYYENDQPKRNQDQEYLPLDVPGILYLFLKAGNHPCTLHFIHVLSDLFFLSLLPFCRPPEVVTCSDSGTFPIDTNCPQEGVTRQFCAHSHSH